MSTPVRAMTSSAQRSSATNCFLPSPSPGEQNQHRPTQTTPVTPLNPNAPVFSPSCLHPGVPYSQSPEQPTPEPLKCKSRSLSIAQLNVQSILGKLSSIEQLMMGEWKADIFCFSETWLQPNSTTDSHLAIPGYFYYRRDRGQRGGGLLVYISNDLCAKRRPDLESSEIECLSLEITMRSCGKLILLFCYRPPDFSPDHFFAILSENISKCSEKSTLILFGDFNAKHPQWDQQSTPNAAGKHAVALFDNFALTQCISTPTRYSSNGKLSSVLDLFATDRPDLLLESSISDPISDHCCVHVTLQVQRPCASHQTRTFYDYKNADWTALRQALLTAPLLESILGTHNVDVAWTVWKEKLREAICRTIPIRTVTVRPKNKPFMNSHLHHLSKKKHRLFRAATRTRSTSDWESYVRARNHCNTEFQKAKRRHVARMQSLIDEEVQGGTN